MMKMLKQLLHSEKFGEIVRFGIVGVLATAIHYAIYYLLLQTGVKVGIAFTIGYAISWLSNFWLSAHFTFRKKATTKKGVGFALSHFVNYLLQIICLEFFIWLGVPAALAPIPVYCVCIPVNFLLVRFVFNSKKLE